MPYLFSYFTTRDESLHLSLSWDGIVFEPVAGGGSIVTSPIGERTLRDPFIGRASDGLFHLLASNGWASTSIVHATSADLLEWTGFEVIPVMSEIAGAKNAWAPEFFLDRDGTINIIWSSSVGPEPDAGVDWLASEQYHSIWSCKTPDFRSYTKSTIYLDPGFSLIDATVFKRPDSSGFLVAKDESGTNETPQVRKDLLIWALSPDGRPEATGVRFGSPSFVEGPTVFESDGRLVMLFDPFLEDGYQAMTSVDGWDWAPARLELPRDARHGSVTVINDAEAARLHSMKER